MTNDLLALWAQRDRARQNWRIFIEQSQFQDHRSDPVIRALAVPVDERSPQQQAVIEAFWQRRTALLTALREAERRIRVASGHEPSEGQGESHGADTS